MASSSVGSIAAGASGREHGEIRIFGYQGRLNRVRYIAFSTFLPLLIVLIGLLAGGVVAAFELATIGVAIMVVGYAAAAVTCALLTIQRVHDFDASGWLALLVLVPLRSRVARSRCNLS